MECNELLQNVTECGCLNREMLRNAEVETTECYEIIYKLIQAATLRNILIHSVYRY